MGHVRLGELPKTRKWGEVVALLAGGGDVEDVAAASARAAESALAGATDDPVFRDAVWRLANLPLAARTPDYVESLAALGLDLADAPGLFDLTGALSDALDRSGRRHGGRTDLGEMAQAALSESLVAAIEPQIPSLFAPEPSDVRTALGRLSNGDRFAELARDFFTRLMQRSLDYYLSRELANHVGPGRRFASDAERRAFDAALALHCRETSRIVEDYAGGWYGKAVWRDGSLTREAADRFYAEEKLQVRRRGGRKRALGTRRPMSIPDGANQRRSLDFVSDAFTDGRRFRILAVVDDFTRECLALVPDTSISGARVARELDAVVALRGRPGSVVSDNGTELTSMAILRWSEERRVGWRHIAPGKPTRDTPSPRASSAGFATRASTRRFSRRCRTPASRSPLGDPTATVCALIQPSAARRRRPSPRRSGLPRRPPDRMRSTHRL